MDARTSANKVNLLRVTLSTNLEWRLVMVKEVTHDD